MPNYRATLDGLDMHLIHAPAGEHALPPLLLLGYPSTHSRSRRRSRGWSKARPPCPGSCPALQVVAPSIHGHGLAPRVFTHRT
jgi:hypothetical protein